MMSGSERVFKIIFQNQGQVYEIFARSVSHGALLGFVEVEELLLEGSGKLVVDPAEERLRSEFEGVRRTFLPMHAVIRIDEVEKEGTAKLLHLAGNGEGAPSSTPFPFPGKGPGKA